MSVGKPQRPASLAVSVAILLLAAGVVGTLAYYTYPSISAAGNSTFVESLVNESRSLGYNYTAPQIRSALMYSGYLTAGVAAFMAIVAGLAWAYVYRVESRGDLARASRNSLYLGVLSIFMAIAALGYLISFAGSLLAGALLIGAWYRIRAFARSLEAAAAQSEVKP